jgi:transcriptional regulator with PAS, ATPase and Fis domain
MDSAMGQGKFLELMRQARAKALHDALTATHGDVYQAADDLGITPQYLYLILRTEFPKGALAKYKKKR